MKPTRILSRLIVAVFFALTFAYCGCASRADVTEIVECRDAKFQLRELDTELGECRRGRDQISEIARLCLERLPESDGGTP